MNATPCRIAHDPSELARRRAASRRLAWVLGAFALFIYGAAFWFR